MIPINDAKDAEDIQRLIDEARAKKKEIPKAFEGENPIKNMMNMANELQTVTVKAADPSEFKAGCLICGGATDVPAVLSGAAVCNECKEAMKFLKEFSKFYMKSRKQIND